jgi:hypothetical protein
MKRFSSAFGAVLIILALGVSFAAGRGFSARADTATPTPLMENEVAAWCYSARCDIPTFVDLPDGYVRAVFNGGADHLDTGACVGVTLPADVEGWAVAYVIDSDGTPDPNSTGNRIRQVIVPISEIQSGRVVCELVVRRKP